MSMFQLGCQVLKAQLDSMQNTWHRKHPKVCHPKQIHNEHSQRSYLSLTLMRVRCQVCNWRFGRFCEATDAGGST